MDIKNLRCIVEKLKNKKNKEIENGKEIEKKLPNLTCLALWGADNIFLLLCKYLIHQITFLLYFLAKFLSAYLFGCYSEQDSM